MTELNSLIESWKGDSSVFLCTPEAQITYDELFQSIAATRVQMRKVFSPPRPILLEAENSFSYYQKFISSLAEGHAILPCPTYQFHSTDYREFLRQQTQTDFLPWAANQELGPLQPSGASEIHPAIKEGLSRQLAQFIIRTSGSSGQKYKFVLHDCGLFLDKYRRIGRHFSRTLAFSPADSIAGFETLFEALSYRASLVAAGDRLSPQAVGRLIQRHDIDYFQTTPSFLNLLRISGQIKTETLGALKQIAFGSEPPPHASTFALIAKELPAVKLRHTYGMSEIGILHTHTPASNPSLFRTDAALNPSRIKDGRLEVRSATRLLCYLNFTFQETEDGWFCTQDLAASEGEFLRVLGRADDTINVAGRKFLPFELENLILGLENVADVTVVQEDNAFIGKAVIAEILLAKKEDESEFRGRFRLFAEQHIPFFMHPHRVVLLSEGADNPRFKKRRKR